MVMGKGLCLGGAKRWECELFLAHHRTHQFVTVLLLTRRRSQRRDGESVGNTVLEEVEVPNSRSSLCC